MERKKQTIRRSGAVSHSEEPPRDGAFIVTTFRVRRDHWNALKRDALERSLAEGGRADASAVLRDVLDRWMQDR